jgi:hypothetical protein
MLDEVFTYLLDYSFDNESENLFLSTDSFEDHINQWNGIYHSKFPEEWAENHEDETGPEECLNCALYGTINNIFIGYCANCAHYIYNGTRGRDFIDNGIENDEIEVMKYESIFDTYLKGVNIKSLMIVNTIQEMPETISFEKLQ